MDRKPLQCNQRVAIVDLVGGQKIQRLTTGDTVHEDVLSLIIQTQHLAHAG